MRALIGLWQFQRGWLRDLCPAVLAAALILSGGFCGRGVGVTLVVAGFYAFEKICRAASWS